MTMKQLFFLSLIVLLCCQCNTPKITQMQTWSYPYPVQLIAINDTVDIAFTDEGKGPKTLVFLHGLGSNLKAWQKNIDVLSEEYRCIALDLPGYGKSSQRDYPFTMPFFASSVNELVKQLKLKKPILVGHSMGGQVAIHANLQAPSLYEQLVLLAPAGFETFSEEEKDWFSSFYTPTVVKATTDEQIARNFDLNFYDMPQDANFMLIDRMKMKADTAAYEYYCQMIPQCVQGMLNAPVFDNLPQINARTLVLFGQEDALIPNSFMHPKLTTKAVGEAGTSAIPRANLIMISEAGHFLQWEKAKEVNTEIWRFISQ